MTVKTKLGICIALLIAYISFVFFLCLHDFSGGELPTVPISILGIPTDKYIHFLMFLPLPVLIGLFFKFLKMGVSTAVLLNIIINSFIALSTELSQSFFTTTRYYDKYDLVADIISIMLGAILVVVIGLLPDSNKQCNVK